MFSEITQKNKLEILGKLTASLSHELRNPLSAIKLNLDYMNMAYDELPDDLKESLSNCLEGVKRIETLIENILSFSRRSKNNNVPISINEVTLTAVNLTSSKASKSKIKIVLEFSDTIPKINFVESHLLQVFLNLITNAIEACDGKGDTVIIRTYIDETKENKNIIWEIEDNGIGIKEEDKHKIFGEFFTSKNRGTGLGLTVCQSLLEERNAEIKFESQYGRGTKFIIAFTNEYRGNDD